MKKFPDKRIGIRLGLSTEFVNKTSQEDLDKYINFNVTKAASELLRKYPDYEIMTDPMFVARTHPSIERNGEYTINTDLWEYIFDMELIKK